MFVFSLHVSSNEDALLKILENITEVPPNRDLIPQYRSFTSKWLFFFANIQEDVWDTLQDILCLDYSRELKFQQVENETVDAINVSETSSTAEQVKGYLHNALHLLSSSSF